MRAAGSPPRSGMLRASVETVTVTVALIATVAVSVGCAGFWDPDKPRSIRLRSVDGLERVEAPLPGVLELRENHQIGSFSFDECEPLIAIAGDQDFVVVGF